MDDWLQILIAGAALAVVAASWWLALHHAYALERVTRPEPEPSALWRTLYHHDGSMKKLRAADEFDLPDWVQPTPGRSWGKSG